MAFTKKLPPLPGLQALDKASNSPHIPIAPIREQMRPTNRDPIREQGIFPSMGADYNNSFTRNIGSGGVSMQSLGNQRTGSGGTGGGSMDFSGNMDSNALISLNPYLEENITSFNHGGNMSSTGGGSGGGQTGNYYEDLARDYFEDSLRKRGMDTKNFQNTDLSYYTDSSPFVNTGGRNILDKYAREQGYNENNFYGPQANKGMKMSEYKKGGKYPHNMFDPETGYKIVADNAAMHNKLNKQGFGHNKPMAASGMKMKQYNQGGFFEQQANQSIQASHQANEQQALGQISGLLAKKLQGQMTPEQATSIASQMAVQSGLANQPMVNQPMAAYGMKMKKYNHGGSMHTGTYGNNYEYYGQSTPYADLDPYDQRAYLAEGMDEYSAQNAAANRGETIMSADGKTGRRRKTYTQGGRF